MKNNKKRFLATLTAFVLAVSAVFAAIPYNSFELSAATDTSKEAEESLKQKIKNLQSEQADLKKKLENAEKNIEATENKKVYLDSLITSTQTEIDTTEQLIAEYEEKINVKLQEIAEKEESIEKKYDQMMERLRFSYEEGTASYLEIILSSASMSDFLSRIDRVSSMMDFDQSLLDELSAQLKVLEDEKTVLENTRSEQEALKTSLENKVSELEQDIKEADSYIATLQANEAAYAAEYEKAKAAEKAANAEIEKILAERQRTENNQYWGGEFIWPVGKNYKTISSYYGYRVLWGRSDFHLGIDIPGKYGSDIYASNGGTVVIATSHYSYGNYVVIDHGGGYSTLYGHNSRLLVKVGDKVEQGDVIAKMGSTGNSTGNHCHFEVRINGKTQNPLNYVRRPS